MIGRAVAGALLAACLAAPAFAVQTRSQLFFRDKLLSDTRTSQAIEDLLREGGGFVDRAVAFRDLTGDDRDDAIVRVHSGGAAGVVAIYVFSTDTRRTGSELQVVYRSQRLLRASTHPRGQVLSFRNSSYAPGDELCCPSKVVETELAWDRRAKRFTVAERRDVAPAPTPTPTPTPAPGG